jgi:hypothetical protein
MTGSRWIAAMVIACGVCLSCNALVIGAPAMAAGVPIRNDTVWKDDRGQEIMCQGGNLCKFGDTFYFYGWGDYPGDNRKDTITCYSSRDLASWKFERHVYTRHMTDLALIVPDRLHVIYNPTTKKYVMIGKHILPVNDPPIPGQPRVTGGVSFFTSEMPAGAFAYLGHEMLPAGANPGTDYHRDLAAFQDDDGTAYVVSSHDQHKPNRNIMITRLTPDYLHVDRAVCEVPLTGGAFEAPYIIRRRNRYWLFVSGGGRPSAWNGSPTYVSTAEKLDGPWTPFRKMKTDPDSKDSFNAQTDFLFEVRGNAGSFVLWGGDRWSQRTGTGIGKNVWLPLHWNGDEPLLKWYPRWNIDAAAGTWTADPKATDAPPTAVPAAPDATSTASLMPRIDDDRFLVGTLPVAAPEIIEYDGQTYIASLLPSLKGISIAKLEWGPS